MMTESITDFNIPLISYHIIYIMSKIYSDPLRTHCDASTTIIDD